MEEVDISFNIMKKVRGAKRERKHDRFGRNNKVLDNLALQLESLNIHTSSQLLVGLSELGKKYKFVHHGIPKILIERELSMPTYTYGYNLTSELVTEKHLLLSKHHVLSIYRKQK